MSDITDLVNEHYGSDDLIGKVLADLREAGKDPDALTRDDLAPFEEFHSGGRPTTHKLAKLLGLASGSRVLDVGSGLGGPARTLAADYGCTVTGIDLTESFCRVAQTLTELVGMSGVASFRHGSALDMPFDNHTFDVAWSQHATMNIEDKDRLFSEIARILRPGGMYAFQEVLSVDQGPTRFPLPWAANASMNFTITPGETRNALTANGFVERDWVDHSNDVLSPANPQRTASQGANPARHWTEKVRAENSMLEYEDGNLLLIRAVFERR